MKTGGKRLLQSMGVETLRSTPQRLLGAESGEGGRKKSRGGGAEQERGGAPPGHSAPEGHTHTDTQTAAGAGGWRRPKLDQPQGASAHRPWAPLHTWAGLGGQAASCPFVPHSRRDKSSARRAGGCAGDVSQEPFLPKPWMRACYTTDLRIIRGAGSAGEKAVQPPGTPQAMLGRGAGQVGPASAWGLGPGSVWRSRGHLGALPPLAPGRPDCRVLTPAPTPGSQGPAWLLGVAGRTPEDPSVPCGPWGQKPQLVHKEAAFSVAPDGCPFPVTPAHRAWGLQWTWVRDRGGDGWPSSDSSGAGGRQPVGLQSRLPSGERGAGSGAGTIVSS